MTAEQMRDQQWGNLEGLARAGEPWAKKAVAIKKEAREEREKRGSTVPCLTHVGVPSVFTFRKLEVGDAKVQAFLQLAREIKSNHYFVVMTATTPDSVLPKAPACPREGFRIKMPQANDFMLRKKGPKGLDAENTVGDGEAVGPRSAVAITACTEEHVNHPPFWVHQDDDLSAQTRHETRLLSRECWLYTEEYYNHLGKMPSDEMVAEVGGVSYAEFTQTIGRELVTVTGRMDRQGRMAWVMENEARLMINLLNTQIKEVTVVGAGEEVLVFKPHGAPKETVHIDDTAAGGLQVGWMACSPGIMNFMNCHLTAAGLRTMPMHMQPSAWISDHDLEGFDENSGTTNGTMSVEWTKDEVLKLKAGGPASMARVLETMGRAALEMRATGSSWNVDNILQQKGDLDVMAVFGDLLCKNNVKTALAWKEWEERFKTCGGVCTKMRAVLDALYISANTYVAVILFRQT